MVVRAWILPLIAMVAVLSGCNRPNWDTPVSAYLSYARALEKRDVKTAWGALSTETRKVLEARSAEVTKVSGGAVKDMPEALFFGGNFATEPVKEVSLVKQDGNVALLSVVPREGDPREVRMVNEGGAWKLDVSERLKQ